ncbi:MAG: PilW family protein [Aestuariibacter sp.]
MKPQGFSLVELLVAMSLLSMVLFIGSFAHSQYSEVWRKEQSDFEKQYVKVKGVTTLYRILSDIQPYVIKEEKYAYHYFQGGENILRSIKAQSLLHPEYPAAFSLFIRDNSLIYAEKALTAGPMLTENVPGKYDFEIVVVNSLKRLKFEYFGWSNVDDWYKTIDSQPALAPSWFGFYSGKDTQIPPMSVKVNLYMEEAPAEFIVPIRFFFPDQIEFYNESAE